MSHPGESVLERFRRFTALEEEYRRRSAEKIRRALPHLTREAERVHVYSFAFGGRMKIAEVDGKNVHIYPPLSGEVPAVERVRWAVIGDLGILLETESGEHKVFPSYTKGPGKVLAIVKEGKVLHRGGLYTEVRE